MAGKNKMAAAHLGALSTLIIQFISKQWYIMEYGSNAIGHRQAQNALNQIEFPIKQLQRAHPNLTESLWNN